MKQWIAMWRSFDGRKFYWCHNHSGSGYWSLLEHPNESLARYVTGEILVMEMAKMGMKKGLDYVADKEPS